MDNIKPEIINKTMDINDLFLPGARTLIREIENLVMELVNKNLKISSWYGCFELSGDPASSERINRGYNYQNILDSPHDLLFPWFLYWEIAWVIMNNDFKPGEKVLDMGGSSSLFSYYLASKGLEVTTVDLQEDLVINANLVAEAMDWNLRNIVMDMNHLQFDTCFHHITSICVYEHIPFYQRVEINQQLPRILHDDGTFSITFDYRNPSKLARINSPEDVYHQFVEPSGLTIRNNPVFFDNGVNYLLQPFYHTGTPPEVQQYFIDHGQFDASEFGKRKSENDYTFGALFLKK